MHSFLPLLRALALFPAALLAETVKVRGTVTTTAGAPIPNAVVTLVGAGLKDTTTVTGAYNFDPDFAAVNPRSFFAPGRSFMLSGSELRVLVGTPGRLTVESFDLRGSVLGRWTEPVSPGAYRFDVENLGRGRGMQWIRVSAGDQVRTFRYMPGFGGGGRNAASLEPIAFGDPVLAKRAAAIDSVRFEAGGFVSKTAAVATYDEVADATLERLATDLEPFSFFLTSQDGLLNLALEFSGSENGFGGDFRYGETGVGAGLRGADKICAALAETSMPGSGAKGWRAFLSAVADENGKQVNAIDRIGVGPWYDRFGRLIAENREGLLNTRPAGDAEIIDDLPNEFGTPNHRPDPTLPEVDNHLTLTGSDQLGELYGTTSTCEDWTSTTYRPGPRVGMSWPQAGNFPLKNWISEWDQTGCEAGFDLDPRTGAGSRSDYSVGKGGGYGGYYCFALVP